MIAKTKKHSDVAIIERLNKQRQYVTNGLYRGEPTGCLPMLSRVDKYNDLKEMCDSALWEAYCDAYGFCTSHDGYDLLA